jgi:hypothetical protein
MIMIRRELSLTFIASPVEPVASAKRGFSFVLAWLLLALCSRWMSPFIDWSVSRILR